MIWYDMIWYDMIYGIIVIMIPALASIYGICWVITDRCMYGPPPAPTPHSTIGSADAPLSSLRKSRCGGRMEPGHAPVQVYSYVWDLQVLNLVQYMYMYPPAPTPDQSLESAEAPLSSLGRGRRQGRLVHRSYTGSIQFGSGEHYLRVFFF